MNQDCLVTREENASLLRNLLMLLAKTEVHRAVLHQSSMSASILVVEDEPAIQELIAFNLE